MLGAGVFKTDVLDAVACAFNEELALACMVGCVVNWAVEEGTDSLVDAALTGVVLGCAAVELGDENTGALGVAAGIVEDDTTDACDVGIAGVTVAVAEVCALRLWDAGWDDGATV